MKKKRTLFTNTLELELRKKLVKCYIWSIAFYGAETKQCRIAMAKAAFNKKRDLFTGTLDFELRKKLMKCYIWNIALYGAET